MSDLNLLNDSATDLGAAGFGLMFYCAASRAKRVGNARWPRSVPVAKRRGYDPMTGRFAQADSIIPQSQGVQAWDRYAYGLNNPSRYTDPSGHKGCDVIDEDGGCEEDQFWNWHNNNRLKPSAKVIAFIKDWEKFSPDPYTDLPNDPAHASCTVGYGYVIHSGPCDGRESEQEYFGISEEQGWDLMTDRLEDAIDAVQEYVTVPLTQEEFDALVSFTYNVGVGVGEYGAEGSRPGLSNSNVLDAVNAQRFDLVPTYLDQWIYPLDAVGLILRRAQEGNMYFYWVYDSTH